MTDQFEREDVEAVAACLGDDAAQIRQELENCRPNGEGFISEEWADNMDRAASMLTWMLLTHPAFADGVGPCGEVQAWQHEDDPARVISAMQKAQALRDGGASASSVKPYSVPLTLGVPAVAPADLRQRFVDWWDHTYGDTKGPAFKAMAWEAAQAVAGVPACSTPSAGEPSQ